jgi:hypothetical protein
MYEPPRDPWREPKEPQRYMGMSAPAFDALVLGVLACIAIAVWVFVFGAWMPSGSDKLDPLVKVGLRDDAPVAAVFQASGGDLKQVFSASSRSFSEEVTSFRGEADVYISCGGIDFSVDMDYAFEAPGRMYMNMGLPFGRSEVLMELPNFYVRPQGHDWYVVTGDAAGINPQAFQALIDQRGVVDYSAQAALLDGLTQLPDAVIEGESFFRYRGQMEFTKALEQLPPGLVDPSLVEQLARASGPIQVDTWLDKETTLPRRVSVEMDLTVEGIRTAMKLRMDFVDYNQPMNIPEAPAEARPITELKVMRSLPAWVA